MVPYNPRIICKIHECKFHINHNSYDAVTVSLQCNQLSIGNFGF